MGCGASKTARLAEIYRIEERTLCEALDPKLRVIRLADEQVTALWARVDSDGRCALFTHKPPQPVPSRDAPLRN